MSQAPVQTFFSYRMGFTSGSATIPAYDPPQGSRQSNWFEMGCGGRPGEGRMLIHESDWAQIQSVDGLVTLAIGEDLGSPDLSIDVRCVAATPFVTHITDSADVFDNSMLEVVFYDRRFRLWVYESIEKAYNCHKMELKVIDDPANPGTDIEVPDFYENTINPLTDEEFTWDELFVDLNQYFEPDESFTPPTTFKPKNIVFDKINVGEAADILADILKVSMAWNPQTQRYRIFEYGSEWDRNEGGNTEFNRSLIDNERTLRLEERLPGTIQGVFRSNVIDEEDPYSARYFDSIFDTGVGTSAFIDTLHVGYYLALLDKEGFITNQAELDAVTAWIGTRVIRRDDTDVHGDQESALIVDYLPDGLHSRMRWTFNAQQVGTVQRLNNEEPLIPVPGVTPISLQGYAQTLVEKGLADRWFVFGSAGKGSTFFPALLNSYSKVAGLENTWDYDVVRAFYDASEGVWAPIVGEKPITLRNGIERGNDGTAVESCGVDTEGPSYPEGFCVVPIRGEGATSEDMCESGLGSGTWDTNRSPLITVFEAEDDEGETIYWVQAMNQHDGVCDPPEGPRGATWFNGDANPGTQTPVPDALEDDYYINNSSKDYFQQQGLSNVTDWVLLGNLNGTPGSGVDFKGPWDSAAPYTGTGAVLDAVENLGSSFIANADIAAPGPNPAPDPAPGVGDWDLWVSKGDQGDIGPASTVPGPPGSGVDWQGAWKVGTAYVGTASTVDMVGHLGASWVANDDTIAGEEPGTSLKWDLAAKGIRWRGDWELGILYEANDAVANNGSSFIVIQEHTSDTNREPGVGVDEDSWWDFLASKGDTGDGSTVPGPAGPGINWLGPWSNVTSYVIDDAVEDNGSSYVANAANTNSQPPNANWDLLAQKGADGQQGAAGLGITWKGTWSGAISYLNQDAVFFDGSSYIATANIPSGGSPPPAGAWDEMALEGAPGAGGSPGLSINWRGTWVAANTYNVNDAVAYDPAGATKVSSYIATAFIPAFSQNPADNSNFDLMAEGAIDGSAGAAGDPIVWRGQWVTGQTYNLLDAVFNSATGSSYICILAHGPSGSFNDEPGVGTNWENFWDLMARVGDQGIQGIEGEDGDPINWRGPWVSTVYNPLDAVERFGSSYITDTVTTADPGADPDNPVAPWDLMAREGEEGTNGTPGTVWLNFSLGGAFPPPSPGTGVEGDYLLDNDPPNNYYQKQSGDDSWTLLGQLQGDQGDPINWRGPWVPGAYNPLDAVEQGGSSYITDEFTTNDPGTDPDNPTAPWDLMAKEGAQGEQGEPGTSGGSSSFAAILLDENPRDPPWRPGQLPVGSVFEYAWAEAAYQNDPDDSAFLIERRGWTPSGPRSSYGNTTNQPFTVPATRDSEQRNDLVKPSHQVSIDDTGDPSDWNPPFFGLLTPGRYVVVIMIEKRGTDGVLAYTFQGWDNV